MASCNCQGPFGNCPCSDRGGYYATKVVRPETPALRGPTVLEDRLHRFSTPELQKIAQDFNLEGRGRITKDRLVASLAERLREGGAPVLVVEEYEESFGRGCNCR